MSPPLLLGEHMLFHRRISEESNLGDEAVEITLQMNVRVPLHTVTGVMESQPLNKKRWRGILVLSLERFSMMGK
jgi:hypothetical protein